MHGCLEGKQSAKVEKANKFDETLFLEAKNVKDNNCAMRCSANEVCITVDEICDLVNNCPDGEDEKQDCGKLIWRCL